MKRTIASVLPPSAWCVCLVLIGVSPLQRAPAADDGIQLPPPEGETGVMLEEEYDPQAGKKEKVSPSEPSSRTEKTADQPKSASQEGFGEALVEGNMGKKSVSSHSGLIWFAAVFGVLVAVIYLLT